MKFALLVPVFVLLLLLSSCGPAIPQKDLDAAFEAFSDAKAAQADVFAPDEYRIAAEANAVMLARLNSHQYEAIPGLAKAVVEAAKAAQAAVPSGVEAVRTDVERLAAEVPVLAVLVRAEYEKARQAGTKTKLNVQQLGADLTAVEQSFAEAQVAVTSGNIGDAKVKLASVQNSFSLLQKILEAAGFKG